jgi:hypothetical protein
MKPGETLNPAGRPKGSKNLSTILRKMLEEEIEITNEEGKKEKKKLQDVLVRKLIKQAVSKENLKAIQEIFDRVEGKPQQGITIENPTELIIETRIIDGGSQDAATTEPA